MRRRYSAGRALNPETASLTAVSGFDYGGLETATANQIRSIADRIRTRAKDFYLEIGRDLIAAHDALGHGLFGKWLDAEFGWTDRTARNFMSAARLAESKSEIVSVLPATALYKLAAPSTPETVRDQIIARVENGESISVKEIRPPSPTARGARRRRRSFRLSNSGRHGCRLATGECCRRRRKNASASRNGGGERRTRPNRLLTR